MNRLEKQKLNAEIIHQSALIERLRARLCGGKHSFVAIDTEFIYNGGLQAPDSIKIQSRKVCTKCELIVNETN